MIVSFHYRLLAIAIFAVSRTTSPSCRAHPQPPDEQDIGWLTNRTRSKNLPHSSSKLIRIANTEEVDTSILDVAILFWPQHVVTT
jgi:hypothetical protein